MGVYSQYNVEVVDPSVTYSFTTPDSSGACMCFPPFMYPGCAPEACTGFRAFQVVRSILLIAFAVFTMTWKANRVGKVIWDTKSICESILILTHVVQLIREVVVLSMTEYTPSPVPNYLLYLTAANAGEYRMLMLLGAMVLAFWAKASAAAAGMRFKDWQIVGFAIGFWLLNTLPYNVLPMLERGEYRTSVYGVFSYVSRIQYGLAAALCIAVAYYIHRALARFARNNRPHRSKRDQTRRAIRNMALKLVSGVLFQIIWSAALGNLNYGYPDKLRNYLSGEAIFFTVLTIQWIQPIVDMHMIARSKYCKGTSETASGQKKHSGQTKTGSGGGSDEGSNSFSTSQSVAV